MNSKKAVPQIYLEKFALGQATSEEVTVLKSLLNDSELEAEVLRITENNEALLSRYPANLMAKQIATRLERESKTSFFSIKWMAPVAMAALLMILIFKPSPDAGNDILLKGQQPHISVYRKTADSYEKLLQKQFAETGNLLQIRYSAAEAIHGVIASIDGNGTVTLHFPQEVTGSTILNGKGEISTPNSYELDNAPDFERFYFITSKVPINVEESIKAIKSQGASDSKILLEKNQNQYMFEIRKH
jgi:hypothetical protein